LIFTYEELQEILTLPKVAVGIPAWIQDRSGSSAIHLKTNLELKDEQDIQCSIDLILRTDRHSQKQRGTFVLRCNDQPLERMSYYPDNRHPNPLDKRLPRDIRGITFAADQHRYYPLLHNFKVYGFPPIGKQIRVCEKIVEDLPSFADGVNYFLRRTAIELEVPDPEFEPRLLV
jgi:hypothetical protein